MVPLEFGILYNLTFSDFNKIKPVKNDMLEILKTLNLIPFYNYHVLWLKIMHKYMRTMCNIGNTDTDIIKQHVAMYLW